MPQEKIFTVSWGAPGALGANCSFSFTMPIAATLVEVSTSGSNANDATIIVGTSADDNGYIEAYAMGDSNVPVVKDTGDFDGALVTVEAAANKSPYIAADTVILVTIDCDGAGGTAIQNPFVMLTFMAGA